MSVFDVYRIWYQRMVFTLPAGTSLALLLMSCLLSYFGFGGAARAASGAALACAAVASAAFSFLSVRLWNALAADGASHDAGADGGAFEGAVGDMVQSDVHACDGRRAPIPEGEPSQ